MSEIASKEATGEDNRCYEDRDEEVSGGLGTTHATYVDPLDSASICTEGFG